MSLLRVYGLTHLEEYKWEQWEEESKGKLDIGAGSSASKDVPDQPLVNSSSTTALTAVSTDEATAAYISVTSQHPVIQDGQLGSESVIPADTQALLSDSLDLSSIQGNQSGTSSHNPNDVNSEPSKLPTNTDISLYLDSHSTTNTLSSVPSVYSSSLSNGDHLESTPSTQHSTRISSIPASASSVSNSGHVSSTIPASVATPSAPVISYAAGPSSSGESIYRVIMNRLTALEANHTLYVRYVEQQSTTIRDLLKRLGEDVGRLEGIVSIGLLDRIICRLTIGTSPWPSTSARCPRMGETKTTVSNRAQRIHGSDRIFVGRGEKHVMTPIPEIEL